MHLGGLGVACQGLVKGLLKQGVQVTLALPHAGSYEHNVDTRHPTTSAHQQIEISSLLQPYDTEDTYVTRTINMPAEVKDIYGTDLGQAIEYFTASTVDMTKDVHPDVVHCHDWMTYEAGIRAARHHRKPLVAHIHATELDRTHNRPNQWIYNREKRGFQAADRIIAVSNYTKNVLQSQYGIAGDKISVVHNGNTHTNLLENFSLRQKTPRRTRPMVLFLGRLAQQKGTHQFLEMAKAIHDQRPDVEFVMAGSGHLFDELIERAIQLGIQDSVLFAGKVSSKEVQTLFAQADCFVMPSLSEPFGLVALEAASHGTPVVLSRQSGASEVLNHAFVVDFWDTHKMADCVLTILRDAHLAEQMRHACHYEIQSLTWENQAGSVKSIYENTLTTCR